MNKWERRIIDYNQRLNEFFDRLPLAMRTLIDDLPTNHAEVLYCNARPGVTFELTLHLVNGMALHLTYILKETMYAHQVGTWPKLGIPHVQWLYDEVDQLPGGGFIHSILLSDDTILSVPFSDFKIKRLDHETDLPDAG